MAQRRGTWVGADGTRLPLLVHLPAGHVGHPRKRWPVVLHLHGAGERGDDLGALVRRSELPRRLEHAPRFPFVVLSPQCPSGTTWGPLVPALLAMLDELVPALRGNAARVHVTGCSMGGSGAWAVAEADPARFASMVPVCASVPPRPGWPARAARLAGVPVWAFHGARDPVLPPRHSQVLAAVHRAAGGRHRLTILRGVGHAAWGPAYGDPRVWRWVARRRRPDRR